MTDSRVWTVSLAAALVLLSAVLGYWASNFFWPKLKSRAARLRALLYRTCRSIGAGNAERWEPVREFLRRVPYAARYIVYVFVLSLAAPMLFFECDWALARILHLPAELRCAPTIAFVTCVAGFSIAILVSAWRSDRIKLSDRVLDKLDAEARPDGGEAEIVPFVAIRESRTPESGREYPNLNHARWEVEEWMIVLRQVGNSPDKYTPDCLEEQHTKLAAMIEGINKKRIKENEKRSKKLAPLHVKWVCYVGQSGRFHAVQKFSEFKFQVEVKKNKVLSGILNLPEESEFESAIRVHMRRSNSDYALRGNALSYPDAIPGFDPFWIEKGATNEQVLAVLIKENKSRAMLVTERRGEPRGVITMTELARQILFKPLEKLDLLKHELQQQDLNQLYGNSPKGFDDKP